MRRAAFAVGLSLAVAAGCASPDPAAEAPPPTLLRNAPADASYRLTVESDEGRGPQVVIAGFDLARGPDGDEKIVLRSVRRGPADAAPDGIEPIAIERDCRLACGGDAAEGGVLGRFPVGPMLQDGAVSALVPSCVPEPVFGAITDILTFLSVQSPGFGADALRAVGNAHRFGAFSATWSRPPLTHAARIDAPGGTLTLTELRADEAVLLWEPDPMHLAIVREVQAAGGRVLLVGTEVLAVEVRCDPRTGALLGGRAVRDDLHLRLFAPWSGSAAPTAADAPETGGMPLAIHRRLTLERTSR